VRLIPGSPPIVPRIPEIDLIKVTLLGLCLPKFKNYKLDLGNLTNRKGSIEFCEYPVYFGRIILASFTRLSATKTTGLPILIQIWVLAGTCAFEFAVLQKDKTYRHENEKDSYKSDSQK
jgi:hypothetical protein